MSISIRYPRLGCRPYARVAVDTWSATRTCDTADRGCPQATPQPCRISSLGVMPVIGAPGARAARRTGGMVLHLVDTGAIVSTYVEWMMLPSREHPYASGAGRGTPGSSWHRPREEEISASQGTHRPGPPSVSLIARAGSRTSRVSQISAGRRTGARLRVTRVQMPDPARTRRARSDIDRRPTGPWVSTRRLHRSQSPLWLHQRTNRTSPLRRPFRLRESGALPTTSCGPCAGSSSCGARP
jgi:hypothetical protein